jgi:hypothetical protein
MIYGIAKDGEIGKFRKITQLDHLREFGVVVPLLIIFILVDEQIKETTLISKNST